MNLIGIIASWELDRSVQLCFLPINGMGQVDTQNIGTWALTANLGEAAL